MELPSHLHSSSIRQASGVVDGGKWGTVAMIPFGPLDRGTARMVLAAVLTLEAMGIAVIVAAERSAQRADEARISVFQKAGLAWKKDSWTYTGTDAESEKGGPRLEEATRGADSPSAEPGGEGGEVTAR